MCESKVHAYPKPRSSALLVSSTTRLAGGLVCNVMPKSMPSSLIFPRARDRGHGTQGNQDAARDIPLSPPEGRTLHLAPQPAASRAREQGVEAVRAQGENDESSAEKQDLHPGCAARRVHELGQESEEEQRGLRVEGVDDHALREYARERLTFDGHIVLLVAAEYPLQSEPDEVSRAQPLHDREGDGGGGEDRREPKRGEGDVHQGTSLYAEHRDEAGGPPPFHATRYDVEDRRSRHDQQHQGCGYEKGE